MWIIFQYLKGSHSTIYKDYFTLFKVNLGLKQKAFSACNSKLIFELNPFIKEKKIYQLLL